MTLDPLLSGPRCDGLADGPVERLDEPCVPAEADLLRAGVDLGEQFIGDSECDMFGHVPHASTCDIDIDTDIVLLMATTKIRMTVTVEVDPAEWADEYGCDPSEVREDVRRYFENQVFQSAAVEDAGLTVTVR